MNEDVKRLEAEILWETRGDEIQKVCIALTELFEPLCERIRELANALVATFEKVEHYSECRKSDRQDFGNIAYTKGRLFKSQVQLNKPKFIQARSRL